MAKVSEDEVLLLWRALMAFRSGPRPACRATGKSPRSPCPLYGGCPRWSGPDDYLAVMEETPEETERRRVAWPFCLNLRDRLIAKGEPVCFPVPGSLATRGTEPASLSARGLYDACLSLSTDARAVGNDVDADGKQLVMITGANQGGKSTFLRSVGLAQLMMQAGMFVAA